MEIGIGGTMIVWLRRDLRIRDNPALHAAAKSGPVLPVFIWGQEEEQIRGTAGAWWLHHSLRSLAEELAKLGSRLILQKGEPAAVLSGLVRGAGAGAVCWNEGMGPSVHKRDEQVKQALAKQSIRVQTFSADFLVQTGDMMNGQGKPYQIFTPFYKRLVKNPVIRPVSSPKVIPLYEGHVESLELNGLGLISGAAWSGKFSGWWEPGETGAVRRWRSFVSQCLADYAEWRDYPYGDGTSRLSPHLAWGEISPRWLWYRLMELMDSLHGDAQAMKTRVSIEAFMRQLAWREFVKHQLAAFPGMVHAPLRKEFEDFPWVDEQAELAFTRWKQGKTGYPLVDAGMRELWETGFMHNRVRMAAASFLVKHLLIPWTKGAGWFSETLLDHDIANNALGWQWVAGSGFDSAPYFRIFNPLRQAVKFDPLGEYVRRWVPELAGLAADDIHCPWESPSHVLQAAGIQLGVTTPHPMVDHAASRERALHAYQVMKEQNGQV